MTSSQTTAQHTGDPVAAGDLAETKASASRSLAERALLVPVGAALTAGDELLGLVASFAAPARAEAQLRQFEERGVLARNRIEQELRRRRGQVTNEVDAHTRRIREQVRNTMGELTVKGGNIASKIHAQVPKHT